MVEISVIVPVYNVSEYLAECLESLINQTFRDIEIICINDGSSDNSLDILEDYKKRDDRINIISQDNKGLGASRNVGLKHSSGKYIFFIDSDDFIELNSLELLHDNICSTESDVVFYRGYMYTDGETTNYPMLNFSKIFQDHDYSKFTFTYNDAKHFVLNDGYNAVLKLYDKKFLDSYPDFYFPESIAFEDILYHIKTMIRASKMSYIPDRLYYYRFNQTSIVNTPEFTFDIFKNMEMAEDFLKENNLDDEFKLELDYFKMKRMDFHLMKSNSEEFFQIVKEKYSQIKPNELFKEDELKRFNLLLDSNNFAEYLIRLYNDKHADFNKIRRENKHLKNKNKKLQKEKSSLKSKNKKLEKEKSTLKTKNNKLSNENAELKKTNDELLNSTSWKVTKPLRSLKSTFK